MLAQSTGDADAVPARSPAPNRWLTVCGLVLIVACEYKFRLRADDKAVSGDPDLFVLLEIAAFAVVGGALFLAFRPPPRLRSAHWVTLALYGYTAVLAVSAVYSPYLEMALVRACQMVIVLALARSLARHGTRATLHHFAHHYAVLVTASVVFGVLVPFPRLDSQPNRFTWLYVHPVVAGQFLAIAVVVLVAYVLGHRVNRPGPRWPVGVYLGLLAVCLAGLVGTNTRGAALGAMVGACAALWFRWRGTRRVEVTAVLTVATVALATLAWPAIREFFVRGESAEQLASLNSRTELWGYAFEAFFERPLYGYGLSATRGLFLDEMGLGGAHNAVVNLLVNNGVVGVVAWLALLAGLVVTTMRSGRTVPEPRLDRTIILAVLLAMLTDSIFVEALGAPSNVACIWLFVLVAWSDVLRSGSAGQASHPSSGGVRWPGRRS